MWANKGERCMNSQPHNLKYIFVVHSQIYFTFHLIQLALWLRNGCLCMVYIAHKSTNFSGGCNVTNQIVCDPSTEANCHLIADLHYNIHLLLFFVSVIFRTLLWGGTQKFLKSLCCSLTAYQNFYLPPSPRSFSFTKKTIQIIQ